MFSFLKTKSKLKELIPSNYIDIHSHLLPGIDDGAKTIDDSKYILESMLGFGFNQIITTPHTIKTVWNNSKEGIESTYEKTKNELKELTSKVQLRAASEYMMDENFVALFKSEKLLTLKENYVLVEMSYLNPPIQLLDILFELQLEGYKPVLAHPERYNFYHSKPKEFDKLKKAGCLFQMNLLSSVGYYGKEVSAAADKLLANEMIDFVGSDIHHAQHIEAFQHKIIIKNQNEFEKAIQNNTFFSI
ncbi:tyrosine-protein phosphatase [Flavobacterium okayamense]|uniref:protein-tyrosine-phosphatase n=1 Tax=Flavobacterium okayamense TaxID=2830782 RepID=A0ABM7S2Q8_9FLAO|nr:CpsB/CapC family capsule biosynthesis tyrosine phosphatase [Flavobacterium okayamense]BCY27260.1 capsular polysaccharide biosynthesis protein [Flavobacterium okayamense]